MVASFTDAWIETGIASHNLPNRVSHLLQMRGLKQLIPGTNAQVAWSHLLQMRGLKLRSAPGRGRHQKSHLLQMRGLKHPMTALQPRMP